MTRAAPSARAGERGDRSARDRVGVEQLGVHARSAARRGTADVGAQVGDHLLRPAEEPLVDVGRRAPARRGCADSRSPSSRPESSSTSCCLAREHVHDLQPGREPVLEVVQLVEEHHRPVRAVGVDQRDRRARLALEDRGDDREHRRDAGAGGDRDVVRRGGRVDRGGEPAGGRHHVELVADDQRAETTPC